MKNEYEESVIEGFLLEDGNVMVKIKDKESVNDEGLSKKINSQPSHLGSFILSRSKSLMNDVILALDGFQNINIYNRDTDNVYIHHNDYEIIRTKGLIRNNLYQSKNDYGQRAVLFGLFLAPKNKDCIVIDANGVLSQKKRLSKDMIRIWWD